MLYEGPAAGADGGVTGIAGFSTAGGATTGGGSTPAFVSYVRVSTGIAGPASGTTGAGSLGITGSTAGASGTGSMVGWVLMGSSVGVDVTVGVAVAVAVTDGVGFESSSPALAAAATPNAPAKTTSVPAAPNSADFFSMCAV